jgi:acyl-CoA thioesterase-1
MRAGWFLYHVASGHIFFTGLALIVAAVAFSAVALPAATGDRRRRLVWILAVLGLLSVATSATPLPWTAYAVGAAVLVVWAFAEARRKTLSRRTRLAARGLVVATCIAGAALEIPFHLMPRLRLPPKPVVAVIGDSVSAGMGENEAVTWPRRLAERHGLVVHDHSVMGATVASARKQAANLVPGDDVVILEIGGNDLLGSTSPADFAAGLDALLHDAQTPGRTVLLFELPLPPGFNAYGLAQRRLAAKHGAVLVPKRVLMGIFTAPGATLDSIHLSQSGHDRMAGAVWRLIGKPENTKPRPSPQRPESSATGERGA